MSQVKQGKLAILQSQFMRARHNQCKPHERLLPSSCERVPNLPVRQPRHVSQIRPSSSLTVSRPPCLVSRVNRTERTSSPRQTRSSLPQSHSPFGAIVKTRHKLSQSPVRPSYPIPLPILKYSNRFTTTCQHNRQCLLSCQSAIVSHMLFPFRVGLIPINHLGKSLAG